MLITCLLGAMQALDPHTRRTMETDLASSHANLASSCNTDLGISLQQPVHVLLQPDKQRRISDQAILYNLRDAGCQLPVRQCPQCVCVDEDTLGLIEGADHVFAQRVVHACFASNR